MKETGEIAEIVFTLKAMMKNLIVSEPIGDNQKYDRIVDNGRGKLSRVQVKCTNYKVSETSHSVMVSHGSSRKEVYTSKDIDFFALYVIPRDVWYIVPVGSFKDKKKIRLSIKSSCPYLKYKERWDYFF